ncbi:hypothetical protein [Urbifossiella limnaea]|uniref:hypothetical protein n=1 Tax=Urbifossiella limnaea TaxID=2528023 RepID=UPI0011A376E8|nr:hypothetical protein [Urbifossiella limnaea]
MCASGVGSDAYSPLVVSVADEHFHPYLHWLEALIHQTADSLDRMLGLKPWSWRAPRVCPGA